MNYIFQAVLLVFILACALMVEAFWSGVRNEKSLTHSAYQSIATGGGFVIYAAIDYLMIAPGANCLVA